jgi:parallel beta-helix repeat protein
MAINPESQYPGKIAPATSDYPYGAARNITVPGDGTGTPWEAALVNDLFGWQQALLSAASIVPTGTPEKVGASQYLSAAAKLFGRVHASIADMKADVYALVGRSIFVIGVGFYTVAASGAGVTLDNGNVAVPAGVVSILHFEATTVSADNTTEIQAAIDSGFPEIYVPDGVFISDTLAGESSVRLYGPGTIKRKASTTGFLLAFTGKNGFIVEGITLDANKAGAAGASFCLVAQTGCYNFKFRDVTVINSVSHGISARDNADEANESASFIEGCTVDASDGCGIEIQNCDNVNVLANRVSNSGRHGILVYGVTVGASNRVTVHGNIVTNSGASGIIAPYIIYTTTYGVKNIKVTDNTVTGSGENGIGVQSNGGVVQGNTSGGNGSLISHQGILINSNYVSVQGNVSSGNTGVGIDFGDCKFSSCTGNEVFDNGIIGIEVNSCEATTVKGNVVRNNFTNVASGVASNLRAGILVHKGAAFSGDSIDTVIDGNIVQQGPAQEYGISVLTNTLRTVVTNNVATSSGAVEDINIEAIDGSFKCVDNIDSFKTSIASAASVTVDHNSDFIIVTGAVNIDNIVTPSTTYQRGRVLTILFTGALTVNDGTGNLQLSGNFVATAADTLTLRSEAGTWYEQSRSVN